MRRFGTSMGLGSFSDILRSVWGSDAVYLDCPPPDDAERFLVYRRRGPFTWRLRSDPRVVVAELESGIDSAPRRGDPYIFTSSWMAEDISECRESPVAPFKLPPGRPGVDPTSVTASGIAAVVPLKRLSPGLVMPRDGSPGGALYQGSLFETEAIRS
jgi:hypothetical protein